MILNRLIRWFQIKFLSVNVKKYGAVGDGNTDDTEAINMAISEARRRRKSGVYFPKGQYHVSKPK